MASLGGIRCRSNRTKALEHDRVIRRPQSKGRFGTTRFCGAAKEQARRREIAVGNEILTSLDQSCDLITVKPQRSGIIRLLPRCRR